MRAWITLIALLFVFLLLLSVLALVAWKLLAAKDAQGNRSTPGCLLGGLTGLTLGCFGLVGLVTFIVGAVAITSAHSVHELVRTKDGVKFGVVRDAQERIHREPHRALHVLLEWKGHAEPAEELVRKLTELCEAVDANIVADYEQNEAGEDVTRVDIALPIGDNDLRELEEGLREALPDLSLEQGVEVELLGAREDD